MNGEYQQKIRKKWQPLSNLQNFEELKIKQVIS